MTNVFLEKSGPESVSVEQDYCGEDIKLPASECLRLLRQLTAAVNICRYPLTTLLWYLGRNAFWQLPVCHLCSKFGRKQSQNKFHLSCWWCHKYLLQSEVCRCFDRRHWSQKETARCLHSANQSRTAMGLSCRTPLQLQDTERNNLSRYWFWQKPLLWRLRLP